MARKFLLLLILASVSCLTTLRTRLTQWQWERGEWTAAAPHSARPASAVLETDLDSRAPGEQILLSDNRVSVIQAGHTLWRSPTAWNVTMAQAADLNWDGRPEVVMLVWRPFQPWPVDAWLPSGGRIADFHDSQNRSCHIILWGWDGRAFRELWAGSALAEPILAFHAADWNGDGRQELMAVESTYAEPAKGRGLALWEWNGFGFSLLGREITSIDRFVVLRDEKEIPSVLLERP